MIRISAAVRELIQNEPVLLIGLSKRLLNLSQVARYLLAAVEVRAQKPVKVSAIAMALSRLQHELPAPDQGPPVRLAHRVTVQRGLAVLTYPNQPRTRAGLRELQARLRKEEGHLTITEGIREITLLVEEAALPAVEAAVGGTHTREKHGVASLSVALTDEHLQTPGILYRLLQPLALQGINLVEVTSTTREFHLYLEEGEVMMALEALHGAFVDRERVR